MTRRLLWLLLCAGAGLPTGLVAGFLALVISGNLYGTGLPDAVLWVPLPLVPLAAFLGLNAFRREPGLEVRLLGLALLAATAFAGEFMVAVLIARADHG
jgi:hypothetical protein